MHILGIDPGLHRTGLGLLSADGPTTLNVIEWLTIETSPRQHLSERLQELRLDLAAYLQKHNPHLAVVERLFFATNSRTALDVAHCRGVILCTLFEHDIPILEPTPLALKSAITGDGRADKIQMQNMVQRLLSMTSPPRPDDAADALALAIFGALHSARSVTLPPCTSQKHPS